jgi:hypothetical protein
MHHQTARKSHHNTGVICQLDAEILEIHDGREIGADAGHNIKGLGSTFGIPVGRGSSIAHDGGDVEDRSPMHNTIIDVMVSGIMGPCAEFEKSFQTGTIEIWVHDSQCSGNENGRSVHGLDKLRAVVALERRRNLGIKPRGGMPENLVAMDQGMQKLQWE